MRASTHNIFSLGLNIFLLSATRHLSALSFLLALWLTLSVNALIDVLGHTHKKDIPIRSFITHSVFIAPLWGAFVGIVTVTAPYSIFELPFSSTLVIIGTGLGMSVGLSHLLLDAPTGGGVYLLRRRIAIAHLKYDDPALNLAFTGLGLLLLLAGVLL